MQLKYFLWYICFGWQVTNALAQNPKVLDSLHNAYKNSRIDTTKIKILLRLADQYKNNAPDTCLILTQKAIQQSEKINYKKGLAQSLNMMGSAYYYLSNYPKALEYYQKALSLSEQLSENSLAASALNNIGISYRVQNNLPKALEYYEKAITLKKQFNDINNLGVMLNNVGSLYYQIENYPKSLEYHQQSLDLAQKNKDTRATGVSLNNIGYVHYKQGNYTKAKEFYQKSLVAREKSNDKQGLSFTLDGLAKVFLQEKDYTQAKECAEKAVKLAQEAKSAQRIAEASSTLYEIHKKMGNYEKSLAYFETTKTINDSLFNIEKSKAISGMTSTIELERKQKDFLLLQKDSELIARQLEISQKRAEAENLIALAKGEKDKRKADSLLALAQKKELEADKLAAQNKIQTAENEKQREAVAFQQTINYLILAVLFSVLVLAYFIFRSRQAQKQLNTELSHKTEEIQLKNEELQQIQEEIIAQRDQIEEQNNALSYHITQTEHSIKAALTIQKAVLPFDNRIRELLKDYFVLYRPRNIVSGDFYWIEQVGKDTFIAVADCTGHGIPGAFMSLIGINVLERIIVHQKIYNPSEILHNMHQTVRLALKQDIIENHSGMDLGLVRLEYDEAGKANICYAGAKRPLYYIDASLPTEVRKIAGSRKAIGGIQNEKITYDENFLSLPAQSMLYMSSDGLEDQNNVARKRLQEKPILASLLQNYQLPLESQKNAIEVILDKHMEGTEQRDDILLLGLTL